MSRMLTDGKDGQHMSITVLDTKHRHIWQGCYPVIQVWLKGLISDLQSVPCWLEIQFVFSGPAEPPVEPVTQELTETWSLCLQNCIMSLFKLTFSASGKLMVPLPIICKYQNGIPVFSVFFFFFFWLINSLSKILEPKSIHMPLGWPSSTIP